MRHTLNANGQTLTFNSTTRKSHAVVGIQKRDGKAIILNRCGSLELAEKARRANERDAVARTGNLTIHGERFGAYGFSIVEVTA
jgi:hypothetical protein